MRLNPLQVGGIYYSSHLKTGVYLGVFPFGISKTSPYLSADLAENGTKLSAGFGNTTDIYGRTGVKICALQTRDQLSNSNNNNHYAGVELEIMVLTIYGAVGYYHTTKSGNSDDFFNFELGVGF